MAAWRSGKGLSGLTFCAALLAATLPCASSHVFAAEKTVRLRLAWGSGTSAKARWTGQIAVADGILTDLQPLAIEADAPVALRIDGSRVIVAPREKRGFDGCDLTVHADEQALVSVWLQTDQTPQPTRIEVPLEQLIRGEVRQPLDDFGSFFVGHRAPGDKLRVRQQREHYVFASGEVWNLSLQPDFVSELASGPVQVDVELRAIGYDEVLWQSSQQLTAESPTESDLLFKVPCPTREDAYRLTIAARREEGFATRFVPGKQSKVLAKRQVEFVVIDPLAKLPHPADRWQPLLTIDPANPKWWQRLPAWASVPGLRERISGAIGNIRPVVRPGPAGDLVELPGVESRPEPSWQSYTLPVREP
ncbi:MAG: hypothetical protein MI725_05950, partial [Pirellulales bacterium]|nr:hypothetical protein [Pirellulales bacterium]